MPAQRVKKAPTKKIHSSTRARQKLKSLEEELQAKLTLLKGLEQENQLLNKKASDLEADIADDPPVWDFGSAAAEDAPSVPVTLGAEPLVPGVAVDPNTLVLLQDHLDSTLQALASHKSSLAEHKHICASSHPGHHAILQKLHTCWCALLERMAPLLQQLQRQQQVPVQPAGGVPSASMFTSDLLGQLNANGRAAERLQPAAQQQQQLQARLDVLLKAVTLILRGLLQAGPCYLWNFICPANSPSFNTLRWALQQQPAYLALNLAQQQQQQQQLALQLTQQQQLAQPQQQQLTQQQQVTKQQQLGQHPLSVLLPPGVAALDRAPASTPGRPVTLPLERAAAASYTQAVVPLHHHQQRQQQQPTQQLAAAWAACQKPAVVLPAPLQAAPPASTCSSASSACSASAAPPVAAVPSTAATGAAPLVVGAPQAPGIGCAHGRVAAGTGAGSPVLLTVPQSITGVANGTAAAPDGSWMLSEWPAPFDIAHPAPAAAEAQLGPSAAPAAVAAAEPEVAGPDNGVTDMVWEALADLPLTFVEDDITGELMLPELEELLQDNSWTSGSSSRKGQHDQSVDSAAQQQQQQQQQHTQLQQQPHQQHTQQQQHAQQQHSTQQQSAQQVHPLQGAAAPSSAAVNGGLCGWEGSSAALQMGQQLAHGPSSTNAAVPPPATAVAAPPAAGRMATVLPQQPGIGSSIPATGFQLPPGAHGTVQLLHPAACGLGPTGSMFTMVPAAGASRPPPPAAAAAIAPVATAGASLAAGGANQQAPYGSTAGPSMQQVSCVWGRQPWQHPTQGPAQSTAAGCGGAVVDGMPAAAAANAATAAAAGGTGGGAAVGLPGGVADRGYWQFVLHALQLTPPQSSQLLALHMQLHAQQQVQLQQQTQLGLSLISSAMVGKPVTSMPSVNACWEGISENASMMQLVEQFNKTFTEGYKHLKQLLLAVWGPESPLTPLQRCRGLVASYPYFPDTPTLLELLADATASAAAPLVDYHV